MKEIQPLDGSLTYFINQFLSGVTGLEIPEVLTVRESQDSIYIKWTAVVGAAEYILLIEEKRVQQPNWLVGVRALEGCFHTVTDLKPWTTYCIRLAAKNTLNQSDFSKPICRTTSV